MGRPRDGVRGAEPLEVETTREEFNRLWGHHRPCSGLDLTPLGSRGKRGKPRERLRWVGGGVYPIWSTGLHGTLT